MRIRTGNLRRRNRREREEWRAAVGLVGRALAGDAVVLARLWDLPSRPWFKLDDNA